MGTDVIPEVTTTPAGETATDPSAPEDSATGPELTDPADPNETGSATTPADSQQPTDPAPDGSDATTDAPGGSGQDQSETTGNGATPSEPADSTESSGGVGGSSNEANPAETNSDGSAMTDGQGQGTAEESETLSTADRLKDVYGEAVSFCHSSMGASGIVCVAAMGAAFVLLRKKH